MGAGIDGDQRRHGAAACPRGFDDIGIQIAIRDTPARYIEPHGKETVKRCIGAALNEILLI
ncbi:hypothetical protein DAH56_00375 [Sphingomonas koreensis]|nr:hypothetical protein DAH56_00375 [Sphingomonas koreensis]